MATYSIGIRKDPLGRYGFTICDGRGSKVAGLKGCATRERAERLARAEADRLVELDRMLGQKSRIEGAS